MKVVGLKSRNICPSCKSQHIVRLLPCLGLTNYVCAKCHARWSLPSSDSDDRVVDWFVPHRFQDL